MKLHIDRLELDLRGDISPEAAQAALRLLAPALAQAWAGERGGMPPASAEGGAIGVAAQPDAATLARQIARALAPRLAPHLAPPRPASRRPQDAAPHPAPHGSRST